METDDMDRGVDGCRANGFCRKLAGSTCERLCRNCMKVTYGPGSSISDTFSMGILPLSGIGFAKLGSRFSFALLPGRLVIPPQFGSNSWTFLPESSREGYLKDFPLTIEFPVETRCACFDSDFLASMDETDESFHTVNHQSLNDFARDAIFWKVFISDAPAREAVRNVLEVCRRSSFENPTHAQIATMTGLNRSTVSQVMSELVLSGATE